MSAASDDVRVRFARPDDHVAAMRVLDGSLLDTDAGTVRERIERAAVLVATVGLAGSPDDATARVVGVLVLDTPEREGIAPRPEEVRPDTRHVEAIAVTRRRREGGIGRALVEAAVERVDCDRLTAEFRAEVAPFYESLGFDVDPLTDGRRRGVLRVGR
ncbi:GNAT family N-acetyltransferase [Halomarina salina]|uniref:GNAT family N-acetyltransferase n=1 Tax=Halomarina salina TaxID=1872699 RepID=A0ABD5RN70_9EURY|nr:GNAT family N-acetyltransferase [Halomarina salina]